MCRLFAVISPTAVDAPFLAMKAPASLLAQSRADKKRLQGDGWGLGWFSRGRPRVLKSPRPLYKDTARLRRAVKQPEGGLLIGHVRWASNPLKLARHELIGPNHTQPFSHRGWLFAHNGTLFIPRETCAALGSWAKYVKGKNDSEVLFYWLMKTVVHGSGSNWAIKLRRSLARLNRIWQSCKNQYPIYRHPYHGLNWVLSNGRILLSFCYVNSNGFDKSRALAHRAQPYYQLQMKITDQDVTVASEPIDRSAGWRPLGHGRLLIAERKGRRLSVKTERVL